MRSLKIKDLWSSVKSVSSVCPFTSIIYQSRLSVLRSFHARQVVTQFAPLFVGDAHELGRPLGILMEDVISLARVAAEVIEFARLQVHVFQLAGHAVVPRRIRAIRHIPMREHELEFAIRHGLQVVLMIIVDERLAGIGSLLPFDQGKDADAVDLPPGKRRARDFGKRREEVDIHRQAVANRARLRVSFPIDDARDAIAAIKRGRLRLAEPACRAGMIAIIRPRPVVGSDDNQGIFLQAQLLHRAPDFANAPVDLHHHVAKQALLALSLELIRHGQRDVRHAMRQIEEEGFVLVPLDEVDGTGGVVRREATLVGIIARHLVAVVGREIGEIEYFALLRMMGPHIVGIGQAIILVEAVLQREELALAPEVPFAKDRRRIALLLQELAHRHLVGMDAIVGIRSRRAGKTDAVRITARQQSGAGSSADGLHREEMREPHALGRQLVDVRRDVAIGAVAREVTIPDVIQIHQNDIREIGSDNYVHAR